MTVEADAATPETLFYGCGNLKYQDFVPLHAASILAHIPNAIVEIGIEDERAYNADHGEATEIVHSAFGRDRFLVRTVDWTVDCPIRGKRKRIAPGSVRFVTTPRIRAEYVYIGDLDIIVLDRDIVRRHLDFMSQTGLPYSNRVRRRPQLTGLHFTRYDAYYPIPDISNIDITLEGDEALLYQIVQLRGLPIQTQPGRPQMPGIHVSPNRPAVGERLPDGRRGPDWGIQKWPKEYKAFAGSALMQDLRPRFSSRIQDVLQKIDQRCDQLLGRDAA